MSYYLTTLPQHPWKFAILFLLGGALISGCISLILTIFAPEARNFFFSFPDKWRTMSRNSAIVEKQRLDALRGDAYMLVLFIMISISQAAILAVAVFLAAFIVEVFPLHLGMKFALLSAVAFGFGTFESRLLRLSTTLSDLWHYDEAIQRLNRWIEPARK